MRIDPDAIEASRPDDREIALLAAEVRRLQAVISSEPPTLTGEEREVLEEYLPTLDETARNLALMSEPYSEAAILYSKKADTVRALLERLK